MKPILLPIVKIDQENPHVKTFWFEYPLSSDPGQFVMLWIPGVDQKPFSIAYDDEKMFGLTVFAVGPLSNALFEMKVGDRVGITGPFGNSFSILQNTHYITVAGGYGAGPLGLLAERLNGKKCTVDFLVGARSQDLLLFEQRVSKLPYVDVSVSTDDGGKGHHGYVTQLLEKKLSEKDDLTKTIIATCGPELMEKAVYDIAEKYGVACEISVERYMKCGFAICGQCCVDDLGIPLCTQGPVLNKDVVSKISEFGKYHRGKSGKKEYY